MRIICPVKRVPDTAATKAVKDDLTLDRESVETVLNANDEWSIEEALRIKERTPDTEVIVLCVGPEQAQTTVRKALSYGLDGAIQITDDAIAGSDAAGIAEIIGSALADEEFDLILMGNQSSDARTLLVPAMFAEYLDIPALTYARKLDIDGAKLRVERETASGYQVVEAEMPAVVSVVEAINEPRYPTFKGIMAAKSKPMTVKSLDDIGLDPTQVGLANAWTQVLEVTPKPPRQAGEKVEDDGSGTVGAKALADFLTSRKFI
ncbi:MAG: electron transfer flavoprotein subunit beta [Nitriliruptorales bacterium]|nr:electron transfer flavoprotein subunit beta [Nitriliruptorales bacterium]